MTGILTFAAAGFISATMILGSFTSPLIKIDSSGNFLPFIAYSVISFCERNQQLVELYSYLKSSPIAKFIKLLGYDTYHVTIYELWDERKKFYPYQLHRGTPERDFESMNVVMKHALFKIAHELKEFPDLRLITVSEIKVFLGKNGLALNVNITSMKQSLRIRQLRQWCKEHFPGPDSGSRIFHITLGYLYGSKEVTDELVLEIKKLEEWIKSHISSISIGMPTPVLATSMTNFIPYQQAFKISEDTGNSISKRHLGFALLILIAILAFMCQSKRKAKVLKDVIYNVRANGHYRIQFY